MQVRVLLYLFGLYAFYALQSCAGWRNPLCWRCWLSTGIGVITRLHHLAASPAVSSARQ